MTTPEQRKDIKRTPISVQQSSSVVAVIENRARQVGLACMHFPGFQVSMTQFVDSSNYTYTVSTLYA